jgi:hypothetical protein
MKKKICISMGVVAMIAIMFITFTLSVNSDNKNDVRLDNIKALACYSLESGSTSGQCCAPWYNVCYMISVSQYLDGERR